MRYEIVIPRPVQRQLDSLPRETRARILARLALMKNDPRPRGSIKLRGHANEYRIRVGDYRVRYEVRDAESVVLLLHCGHRKDAYR